MGRRKSGSAHIKKPLLPTKRVNTAIVLAEGSSSISLTLAAKSDHHLSQLLRKAVLSFATFGFGMEESPTLVKTRELCLQ
jgi:hypothetical protein